MKLLKDEVQHLVMEALETLGGDSSLVEKMLQANLFNMEQQMTF